MARRPWRFVLVAALAGAACNAISGVGDLELGPSGTTATDGGGGGGEAASGDAGAPDEEAGTLPTCSAGFCVPAQDGWTPVVRTGASNPCPAQYAESADLFVAPRGAGAAACGCTCASSGKACTGTITVSDGTSCANPVTTVTLPDDGGCAPLNLQNVASPTQFTPESVPGPGVPSCTPQVTPLFAPPTNGRLCTGAAGTAGECGDGQVCVPPASGGSICVEHEGDVECPAGVPRRFVYGSDPQDGRACSACACGKTDCSAGSLTLFNDSQCIGIFPGKVSLNKCANVFVVTQGKSAKYVPSTGCAVTTPPTVTGALTFSGTRTVCCP